MLDGDILCRAVLFPRQWTQGVYSSEAALALGSRNSEGKFCLSFGSKYLLRNTSGVHEFGISTADLANAGIEKRLNRPLNDSEKQQYVAFYDIFVGSIRQISLEMHNLDIRWKVEHGRQEHFEIQISEMPSAIQRPRKERQLERTRILAFLFARFWGPCVFLNSVEVGGNVIPIVLPEGKQGGCEEYKI